MLLHYVFLVTWGWMLAQGLVLYAKFVTVFGVDNSDRLRKFAVYAYGGPLFIVIPSYAFGSQFYGNSEFCWIDSSFIWVVAAPVAVAAVSSLFFLPSLS